MSENTLKVLLNLRSLRAIARETTLENLELASEKLNLVIEEKRQQIVQEEAAAKERVQHLAKYKEMLAQDNVTLDELQAYLNNEANSVKKTKKTRPAKYQFPTANGKLKTWSGQGRTPYDLQAQLDAGKSLADFEIK